MKNLLSSSAFLVVNKTLAKNIGLKETILLADLISKEEYFINNGMTDGWFFNTEANIQKDTTLTPYQQRNALKSLKNNQIIETMRKGIPAKQFFKINEEQVIKFLNNKSSTNLTTINKNKEIILNNKLSIKEKFINQVMYFDYPKEMKEDFISYWTEGVKKMRFQKQGTFEIKLRLERWSKNSAKWDKPKSKVSSKLDSQLNELVKAKNYL
tara:strand:+ start:4721 stop:5353 length:633 start_codon:yes stop_codon:yes gene_type:complete